MAELRIYILLDDVVGGNPLIFSGIGTMGNHHRHRMVMHAEATAVRLLLPSNRVERSDMRSGGDGKARALRSVEATVKAA